MGNVRMPPADASSIFLDSSKPHTLEKDLLWNFRAQVRVRGLLLDKDAANLSKLRVHPRNLEVALPAMQAGGDEQMFKENNKKFEVLDGSIDFKVTGVNSELGEIGGVFVQQQPSDTDLGSKVPKQVLLKGVWFGTVEKDA
jgi:hypothetical protein